MKYLEITNSGIMEMEALTLLGASTKRGDSSTIGEFGTGNKFAIPYFIRNGINIKIFRGVDEVKITTVEKKLRDQVFDVIVFNGSESSFTTEAGHGWDCWQALREVYCNAKDEGGLTMTVVDEKEVKPAKGWTIFYIEYTNEVEEFYRNKDDYFAFGKEILFENKFGKILKKHGTKTCVYRKGIKCFETDRDSLFDYDFNNIDITEDRMVKYSWAIFSGVWKLILNCTDKFVIRTVLENCKDVRLLESKFDTWNVLASDGGEIFKEVVKELIVFTSDLSGYVKDKEKVTTTFLPNNIYSHIRDKFKEEINLPQSVSGESDGISYIKVSPTPDQSKILLDIDNFLKRCKFENEFEIILAIVLLLLSFR